LGAAFAAGKKMLSVVLLQHRGLRRRVLSDYRMGGRPKT
jgi:hypothetical protein